MSNKNQDIVPLKLEKKNIYLVSWLALIIVIAVATIAIAIVLKTYYKPEYLFVNYQQKNAKTLPDKVYSYTGTITKLEKDYLIIKALASKNYLLADQLLMVKIDDGTQISGLIIPKTIAQAQKTELKSNVLSQAELKVGQNVTVSSLENIKNKISFTADKIEAQIVK